MMWRFRWLLAQQASQQVIQFILYHIKWFIVVPVLHSHSFFSFGSYRIFLFCGAGTTMFDMHRLPDDIVIIILGHLTGVDLAALEMTSKSIFSKERISCAIKIQLEKTYNVHPSSSSNVTRLSPMKNTASPNYDGKMLSAEFLYSFELSAIQYCLQQIKFSDSRAHHPFLHGPNKLSYYWVSCAWVAEARTFYKNVISTYAVKSGGGTSSNSSSSRHHRIKRNKNFAPRPISNINRDITCEHGLMYTGHDGSTSLHKTKKTAVPEIHWHLLRRFFPDGSGFPCKSTPECNHCLERDGAIRAFRAEHRNRAVSDRWRSVVSDPLLSLNKRKSGVPMDCLTARIALFNSLAEDATPSMSSTSAASPTAAASAVDDTSSSATLGSTIFSSRYTAPTTVNLSASASSSSSSSSSSSAAAVISSPALVYSTEHDLSIMQPLLPGIYHIVPRWWLKEWRKYAKDMSVPTGSLPPIHCGCLLCGHLDLLVPRHLQEFLIGLRKMLYGKSSASAALGNSRSSSNNSSNNNTAEDDHDAILTEVEVVTVEEWDAFTALGLVGSEVCPSFALDGQDIIWNMRVCEQCNVW